MNVFRKTRFLFILMLLFSCKEKQEHFSLSKTKIIKIIESEKAFISQPNSFQIIDSSTALILDSRTTVHKLNLKTGELENFISFDSASISSVYSFIKSELPRYDYLYDTLTVNNHTFRISGLQVKENFAYVSIFTNFSILAKLDGIEVDLFSIFSVIQKYDINTMSLNNQYYVPGDITTNLSIKDPDEGNYICPTLGFYFEHPRLYVKNNCSPITDSSSFIFELIIADKLDNKRLMPLYHNREKQRRKDMSFNKISFNRFNSKLYCSDGKDIFSIDDKNIFEEIVQNKYKHLKSFKILEDSSILFNFGCDTSKSTSLELLKNGRYNTIIPNKKENKLIYMGDKIYVIKLINDEYYIEIHSY